MPKKSASRDSTSRIRSLGERGAASPRLPPPRPGSGSGPMRLAHGVAIDDQAAIVGGADGVCPRRRWPAAQATWHGRAAQRDRVHRPAGQVVRVADSLVSLDHGVSIGPEGQANLKRLVRMRQGRRCLSRGGQRPAKPPLAPNVDNGQARDRTRLCRAETYAQRRWEPTSGPNCGAGGLFLAVIDARRESSGLVDGRDRARRP